MPIRLLVKSKAETGERPPQEVMLSGDAVNLGRDKTCEVVLNDQVVSRRHAQILREGALYFLEDTGSSYGTRINGADLPAGEKRLLKNGDVIAIGPFDVTFDRVADVAAAAEEKTSYVAKRVVKDALRGLANAGMPYLRVMNGPLEGKRFELGDAQELVIGRDEGVEVLLEEDDLVSRRHAKVRRDWSGTTIEDLGSRNGIKVNRRKVGSQPLKDRDEVEVGGTRFLFLDPAEVRDAPVIEEKPRPKPSQPAAPKGEPAAAAPAEPDPAAAAEPEKPAEPEPEPKPEEQAAEAGSEEKPAEPEVEPPAEPVPAEPSAVSEVSSGGEPEGPQGRLGGNLRRFIPLIVVGVIAVFALGVLALTFFVM